MDSTKAVKACHTPSSSSSSSSSSSTSSQILLSKNQGHNVVILVFLVSISCLVPVTSQASGSSTSQAPASTTAAAAPTREPSAPAPAPPPPATTDNKPSSTTNPASNPTSRSAIPPPPPPPPPVIQPAIITTTHAIADTTTTTATTRAHSSKSIHVQISPSETPYGSSQNGGANNGIMLIVSLAVIFGLLASMGGVVFCLFRRRSKKQKIRLFIKGNSTSHTSSSGLDQIDGDDMDTTPGVIPDRRTSNSDMSRALQEMTEQHQNALLSRKSSTLSLGRNYPNQSSPSINGNRMLNPTLPPQNSFPQGGPGYWNTGRGSVDSSSEYRGNQFNDYYGAPPPPPQFPYNGSPVGFNNGSGEHLLSPYHPGYYSNPANGSIARRSSLSPGLYPHPEQHRNHSPLFRAKTISMTGGGGGGYQGGPYHPQPYYSHQPSPGHSSIQLNSNIYGGESSTEELLDPNKSGGRVTPGPGPGPGSGSGVLPEQSTFASPSVSSGGNSSSSGGGSGGNGFDNVYGHPPMRPHSPIDLPNDYHIRRGSSPDIVIPPSITTRRRSMLNPNNIYNNPNQGPYYPPPQHPYHQQPPPSNYIYPQENSGFDHYPTTSQADQAQMTTHELVPKENDATSKDEIVPASS
ncbi:hypothetical protein BGZ76_002683 [Entomortierella beljakovae]|nr:hypothetical protein BGZ76_002683 [Entomortierella beljakovae]